MKTKQITPRQKHERARRQAMPIALIQRPLKFIESKDFQMVTGKDGRIQKVLGEDYQWARMHANAGYGGAVQATARTYLYPPPPALPRGQIPKAPNTGPFVFQGAIHDKSSATAGISS